MESTNKWPNATNTAATPAAESARLDQAMRKADDLLFSSLKQDEVRRHRRRTLWIGAGIIVAICVLVFVYRPQSKTIGGGPAARTPASANELTTKGWEFWQHQQYAQADDAFSQAVKINPQLTNAWNGLGWSRFNGGDGTDGALDAFQHAVALEPTHPGALNGIGQIYFARSQFDKAEPALLAAAPNAPAAWWALTKMYLLESQWSSAEKYAQMIVDSRQVTGPDLAVANAMLDAAKSQYLPDDLRMKIAPPSYMASHVKSAPDIQQLAAEGGGVPVQFTIGAKDFSPGDSIVITDIHGTAPTFAPGNIYCIKGAYTLASHDHATLAASTTAKYHAQGIGSWIKNQSVNIVKGTGLFTLYLPLSIEGSPHISMYGNGGSFGGVYFGTGNTLLKSWGNSKPTDTIGH